MHIKSFFSSKRTRSYENILRMYCFWSIFFLLYGFGVEFVCRTYLDIPPKSFKFLFDIYAYTTTFFVIMYSLCYNISFTSTAGDQSLGTPSLRYETPPKFENKF